MEAKFACYSIVDERSIRDEQRAIFRRMPKTKLPLFIFFIIFNLAYLVLSAYYFSRLDYYKGLIILACGAYITFGSTFIGNQRTIRRFKEKYGTDRLQYYFAFYERSFVMTRPGEQIEQPYRRVWNVLFTKNYIHLLCLGRDHISIQRNAISVDQRAALEVFLRSIPEKYKNEIARETNEVPAFSFTSPNSVKMIHSFQWKYCMRRYLKDRLWYLTILLPLILMIIVLYAGRTEYGIHRWICLITAGLFLLAALIRFVTPLLTFIRSCTANRKRARKMHNLTYPPIPYAFYENYFVYRCEGYIGYYEELTRLTTTKRYIFLEGFTRYYSIDRAVIPAGQQTAFLDFLRQRIGKNNF